jgi:putative peptidoglycan lipid II flippase
MPDLAHTRERPVPSANRRLFANLITVGMLSSAVKLAGALKVVVTAHFFGTSDAMDAFLIAFIIPAFVADIAAGSLSPSLIPTLVEVRIQKGEQAAQRLYSSVLLGTIVLLVGASLLLIAASGVLLPLLAAGFDPAKLGLTRTLFLWLMCWVPLSAVTITWRSVLNAADRFALSAWAPVMTPLLTIVFLAFTSRFSGPYALVAGTIAGVVAEVLILGWAVRREGFPVRPHWYGWSPELRQVFRQYTPMVAGTLMLSSAAFIDQSIAARLGGGSVATFTYGTKFVSVLLAIGAMSIGTAALPHLSRMVALNDWQGLRHTLRTYSILIVAVSVPLALALMYYSTPLVRIVLQRGAFTADASAAVAAVQRFSLVQLPFGLLLTLVLRVASSIKLNQLLLWVAGVTVIVNVALDYSLMQWYGVRGIALADAGTHIASLMLLWLLLRRYIRGVSS